jgi:hypothetical protein
MSWTFRMSGRSRGAATRVTVCGAVRPPEPRVDQSEGTVERSDPRGWSKKHSDSSRGSLDTTAGEDHREMSISHVARRCLSAPPTPLALARVPPR